MEVVHRFPNDVAALVRVAAEVREQLAREGVGARTIHAVDLALEELVVNVIRHGYHDDAEHELEVRLALSHDALALTLVDDGRPFDATRAPPPPAPTTLADTPVGGRGIAMVRAVVADMRYRREGERNVLELWLPRE